MSMMDQRWQNPEIAPAREAALAALRPTPAQLERGLALHAAATVVDMYGFSAMAAPDGNRLRQAAEQGLDPLAIRRLHAESRMTRMAENPHQRELFAEAWRASGVTCVIRNSGEEGNRIDRLIERLAHNTYVADRLPGVMRRATTADDIAAAKREDRHCFIFTTNGVPLVGTGQQAAEELSYIRLFHQLGVRMMHLTYNRRNVIGDGCAETRDGGLSDFGRDVVAEMNRAGVLVDVAHSSHQTCLDAATASSRPIVVSHATCAALNSHCRAKQDSVLRAVAETGGLTGICCIPAFLGRSGDVVALLDHIDHAVAVAGIDHVAIGTDVVTALPPNPDDAAMPQLPPAPSWQSHWPANDAYFDPRWDAPQMVQSLAWINWPLFTVGLVQRGYSDEQIRKLIGGNGLRVLQSACERTV